MKTAGEPELADADIQVPEKHSQDEYGTDAE
jgi:hypothetical protein